MTRRLLSIVLAVVLLGVASIGYALYSRYMTASAAPAIGGLTGQSKTRNPQAEATWHAPKILLTNSCFVGAFSLVLHKCPTPLKIGHCARLVLETRQ